MTDVMTTNVATVPAQSADLLAAVSDLTVLALGGAGAAEESAADGELSLYLQQLERVGELAGEREYAGVQTGCLLFQGFLDDVLSASGDRLDGRVRRTLESWPELLHDYLISPPGTGTVEAVLRHLRLPLWNLPLMDEDVEMLRMLLREERPQAGAGTETRSLDPGSDRTDTGDAETLADPEALLEVSPEVAMSSAVELQQPPEAFADSAEDPEKSPEAFAVSAAQPEQPSEVFTASAEEPEESPEAFVAPADQPEESSEAFAAPAAQSEESPEAFVALAQQPEQPFEAFTASTAEPEESPEAFTASTAEPEESPAAFAVPAAQPEDSLEALPVPAVEPEESPEAFVAPAEQPEQPFEVFTAPSAEPEESSEAFAALAAQFGESLEAFPVPAVEPEESLEALVAPAEQPEQSFEAFTAPTPEPEKSPEAFAAPAAQLEESPEAFVDPAALPEALAAPTAESEEYVEEDLPPEVVELVAMLLDELPLMDEALERLLQLEMSSEDPPAGRPEAAEVYADYLDRFADAAEAVGFSGLQQVVVQVHENLDLLTAQPRAFSAPESELLATWSAHAGAYLVAPHSAEACQDLIDWLKAPGWPQPLAAGHVQDLQGLLQAPTPLDLGPDPEVEARPQQATPEDVSLALPEDVNPDLLDALLQELPAQSQTFSQSIQNLIAGGSLDDINVAQRMAHTLKGAANTVGVYGLAILTHQLEDILVALAKEEALPTPALAMSLMNAADCLEAMGEALCGIGEAPDNARAVLQEVLDWANRIDREGLPEEDTEAQLSMAMPLPEPIVEPAAPLAAPPSAEGAQQSQAAAPAARTQVATELVDDLLRLGGETIILGGQVHEQVRRIDERMLAMQAEFERLQRLGGELERLIDIRDLSTDRRGQDKATDFDALEMDQYSELHTTSRMLVEAATDARQIGAMVTGQLKRLDTMLLTQERLNRESQETVFSARMVPIKTVAPRLQRSVRQTCRLTGKQVELHLSGAETLMDGEVLNVLIDPLMHVLRNAVDHGIESPAQRSAAGKPESGNIQLDFLREGNNILVRCRDDGAGFDYAAIRRAAETRGLLELGQTASEEELTELLLMPNFSSRPEVTQTSGRGVGLDVVYSHVASQGGSLDLKSESGKGSTTELRLPVSLISTHALLVQVRGQVMAVADRGIERILHANDGELRRLGDQPALQVDDQIYPLRQLDEILRLPPNHRAGQRVPMPVLLVRERSGVTAVQVQKVLSGTDLVVKELSRHLPRLPGIVGATILGDGAVTPVLDLPELAGGARGQAVPAPSAATVAVEQEIPHLPLALVVDDSLSARRALVQVMEDAGYEVRAARDGMEAAQVVAARRPDIVLADMEMPRMNGIELTSHLRARPQTADLPVIMITSRSTAKHRRQAEAAGVNVYLTKPFLDDQLLEHVAVLRGQI